MNNYKQIVVLSGKGGTGKTTISSAFSAVLDKKITIDCDVDAANLYLILNPAETEAFDFYGSRKAEINPEKCSECRICEGLCEFDAINDLVVDPLLCEGCGFCVKACPAKAISFKRFKSGEYYACTLPDRSKFYYARLKPGEGNSGKLVSEIKRKAVESADDGTEWIIVDGPPGIGCPVNASLSGADYAVIVTEPSPAGIHDLKRLNDLLKTFSIPAGIIINKYDLNYDACEEIRSYAAVNGIDLPGQIPFREDYIAAIKKRKPIVETDKETLNMIRRIWSEIKLSVNKPVEK